MADEKKDKKPAPAKPAGLTGTELIIAGILLLAVVGTLLERVYSFLASGDLSFYGVSLTEAWGDFRNILPAIKVFSYALSAVFIFGIVVLSQLKGTILIAEKKKLFPQGEPEVGGPAPEVKNPMTDRWLKVLEYIESANPSDWRHAIIDADIMLGELLEKLNLPGETIGDKMKAVEKSDFVTIDFAWEAHKIRNQIAHEGSEFMLNQREARRVITLYKQVFEEFYMI